MNQFDQAHSRFLRRLPPGWYLDGSQRQIHFHDATPWYRRLDLLTWIVLAALLLVACAQVIKAVA